MVNICMCDKKAKVNWQHLHHILQFVIRVSSKSHYFSFLTPRIHTTTSQSYPINVVYWCKYCVRIFLCILFLVIFVKNLKAILKKQNHILNNNKLQKDIVHCTAIWKTKTEMLLVWGTLGKSPSWWQPGHWACLPAMEKQCQIPGEWLQHFKCELKINW